MLYTVVHVLNKVNFRPTESSLVRNIIDMIISFSVFSMSSSYLNEILVCNRLEFVFVKSKVRKMNVN